MPKAIFSVALDLPLANKLAARARSEKRTVSQIISSLLQQHFDAAERRSKPGRSGRIATITEHDQLPCNDV